MDSTPDHSQVETADPVLGSDPWMRFDLWAGRSWEATETALEISLALGESSDSLDNRVIAAFNAAENAKEIAEMVNPLFAADSCAHPLTGPSDKQTRAIISLLNDGDLG